MTLAHEELQLYEGQQSSNNAYTYKHTPAPPHPSALLRCTDTEHQHVHLLQVVARNRSRVRQHLALVRQPNARHGRCAPRRLQDTIPQRRHKEVERQLRQRDRRPVQLPLRFRIVLGELYLERDRVLGAPMSTIISRMLSSLTGCMAIQSASG